MEGMQYIQHRVIDGTYQAVINWRVKCGIVEIKQPDGWLKTTIPVKFVKDFELTFTEVNKVLNDAKVPIDNRYGIKNGEVVQFTDLSGNPIEGGK